MFSKKVCETLLLLSTMVASVSSVRQASSTLAHAATGRRLAQTCGSLSITSATSVTIMNASIGQSNPLAAVSNTLTATLTFSVDLETNSTITVAGLTGSQTADNADFSVTSSADFGATWVMSTGTLSLTARSCLPGNTAVEIAFTLRNPAAAQASPAVTVSGQIPNGTMAVSLAEVAMDVPNSDLLGVASGRNPLRVVVPTFLIATMSQSNGYINETNTITLSLTSVYAFASGSRITLMGLSGLSPAQLDSSTTWSACNVTGPCAYQAVTMTSPSSGMSVTSAFWNDATKEIVLTVGAAMTENTAYEFQIVSANPAATQAAPSISFAGFVEAGDFDSPLTGATLTSTALLITVRPAGGTTTGAATAAGTAAAGTTALSGTPTPAGCPATKFGDNCALTCAGTLNGAVCECPAGQFGFDCSQTATADAANSIPATMVVAGAAATITGASGIGVDIPAGAITTNTSVSVSVYDIVPTLSPAQATLTPVGPVCDFQPEGVTFAQKVDLTLVLDATKQAAEAAKGNTFKAHFLDKTTQLWTDMGGTLDAAAGTLTTQTDHFSLWTVMSVPATATPEPDDDGGGMSTTTIIIIAACAGGGVLLLCCIVGFLMRRNKQLASKAEDGTATRDVEAGPKDEPTKTEDPKPEKESVGGGADGAETRDIGKDEGEEAHEDENGSHASSKQRDAAHDHTKQPGSGAEGSGKGSERGSEKEGSAEAEVGFFDTVRNSVGHFFESIRDAFVPGDEQAEKEPEDGSDSAANRDLDEVGNLSPHQIKVPELDMMTGLPGLGTFPKRDSGEGLGGVNAALGELPTVDAGVDMPEGLPEGIPEGAPALVDTPDMPEMPGVGNLKAGLGKDGSGKSEGLGGLGQVGGKAGAVAVDGADVAGAAAEALGVEVPAGGDHQDHHDPNHPGVKVPKFSI